MLKVPTDNDEEIQGNHKPI